MKLKHEQLLSMLKLQDEMNSVVNPDWRSAGYYWNRAIMVEAVEAIEHHGWKWWKHQTPDMPQLRMELVDIWHFMLSDMIQTSGAVLDELSINHLRIMNNPFGSRDIIAFGGHVFQRSELSLLDCLQGMVALAAANEAPNHLLFGAALEKAGMDWSGLYSAYIGKNCLNIFRQANGYKQGKYLKDWSVLSLSNKEPLLRGGEGGRKNEPGEKTTLEDNDHLHDIMQRLDPDHPGLIPALMDELERRYAVIKPKPVVSYLVCVK